MAFDAWPVTLPRCFALGSTQRSLGDGRLRSQTDTGPGKVRRRSSAPVGSLSGQMVMTKAQKDDLLAFIDETLLGGALAFTFPDQEGGGDLLVRFADAMPSWRRIGATMFMVDLKFEVLP